MKAFEVLLNDKRFCVGGIGEHGVLTAIVDCMVSGDRDEVGLRVGGLVTPKEKHVQWGESRKLAVGDVRIKIVEVETVGSPTNTKPADLAAAHNQQKEYIREAARKFGWTITDGQLQKVSKLLAGIDATRSRYHSFTVRKKVFLWVEECKRLAWSTKDNSSTLDEMSQNNPRSTMPHNAKSLQRGGSVFLRRWKTNRPNF